MWRAEVGVAGMIAFDTKFCPNLHPALFGSWDGPSATLDGRSGVRRRRERAAGGSAITLMGIAFRSNVFLPGALLFALLAGGCGGGMERIDQEVKALPVSYTHLTLPTN